LKAKKMANEDVSLLFTQNRRFSSLPRRNAMKPGHLHQIPEALLACPAIALATADEVAPFGRL